MWLVGGEWTVAKGCVHSHNPFQLLIEYKDLVLEGFHYLTTCSFAILITLKSSCAIIIGSADVLNVQLSHNAEDEDRDSRVVATQQLFFVSARTSVKKHGHHMILICCNTNLGSLYTMVHSDLHGNAVLVVLLVLLERVS